MSQIRLRTTMAGPKGSFSVGDVLTVGVEITEESAQHLVGSRQADWVDHPVEREEIVETTEAPPAPETTAKATRKPRARRKPKGK